ncbi:MAG: serine hydrolase [Gemmatimonas sp.]|jgi:D-alanyl-D-alanine carboxypeptidase|uniref:serine hydrolase n=1 Tax=Gemmatimonas sp. TaxID=1962908 RepID=UPI0022C9FF96|nr:serine hydrolase [Gemmatimonas sp.]MCA2995658.1 serine hydrolase [Gemmatimonas sp.]MCZ8014033.1 serine hydrolase [Gemmatimonas sp.]MCZ8268733.1 serine hydrolase [Gemmatimonas sp.]
MITAVLCALLQAGAAQTSLPPAESIGPALQRIADSVVAARPRMPGIIIAMESKVYNRRWSVAAGMSDTARKVPLRPEQPVRIASNTKTYVAAALLRLGIGISIGAG